MKVIEIIYLAIISVLGVFLAIGGYRLQRDRYWEGIWNKLGKPQVETIEELKKLMK